MDATTALGLLDDMRHVKQQARGDRRATSVPLLVFGALAALDAALQLIMHSRTNASLVLLAPAGFAAIALYYRRHEIAVGVGSWTRSYAIAAVATVAVFLLTVSIFLLFGFYVAAGIGLLAIAVRQRNLYLGVWAGIYGVVGALEGLSLISNRLYTAADAFGLFRARQGYFSWSHSAVYGALGLMLIGAGLYARRQEAAQR